MTITISVDPEWNICDWAPQLGPTQPLGQGAEMPTTCDDTPVLRIANREQHYDYYACARHHDQLICAWHPDVPCRSMAQPLGQVTS